ncbi:class I SAM-dependent methyltransferase [Streptomyces sp. NPDC090306]|uniref:class I SAM-dependent methyltransferase n=1 Tax=Streptomyces sp. NPDC090306 TaxID=3365961 RepID=UPI0038066C0A
MPSPEPAPAPVPALSADRRRAAYAAELARGTGRFHEPRRADCPWCGSVRLRTRLRTADLRQHKPGTFVVDECRDCAHLFQNPRLTAEGRAFYAQGLPAVPPPAARTAAPARRQRTGGHEPEAAAASSLPAAAPASHRRHRAAARAMLAHRPEPESWLDVGTGRGHFPRAARTVFPYTSFDGLDTTSAVQRARAAGHVEEAHIGALTDPDVLARLRGRYDVVSMFHHLERVPDPRAELRAALQVLRPGGHLMIDVFDPRCAFGVLLGRWWAPHGQPGHLHLTPRANLRAELEDQGCDVLSVGSAGVHTPYDLAAAAALALGSLVPEPDAPWRPAPPTGLRRGLRTAVTRAGAPIVATAGALDHALAPLAGRTRFANTYRVVARRGPA